MRMKTENYIVTIFKILAYIFNLRCKYMRHSSLNCSRNIDYCLIILRWLPYIKNCITHFYCIVNLCAMKAFRTVFKRKITFRLICKLLK